MARYLVVANLTLGGKALHDLLEERLGPSDRVHVLVPASPVAEGFATHDEAHDVEAAQGRLETCLRRLSDLDVAEVTGEIGAMRALDAVGDCVRANSDDPFDEIVISTLPPGPSRWLKLDLVNGVRRRHTIPVTHVTATETV